MGMSYNDYANLEAGNPAEWYRYNESVKTKNDLVEFLKRQKKKEEAEPVIQPEPISNEMRGEILSFINAKKAEGWEPRRIKREVEKEFGIDILR